MNIENTKMQTLPIFKHFEGSEIGKSVNSFRKGEKGLFGFVKLAAIGAIGYFSWVYILPTVFLAIGQALAVVATGVIVVGVIIMLPVILKGLKRFTRFLHKMVIRHDPFAELEDQKIKMLANKTKFQRSKGKIYNLKSQMEVSASESEEKAKKLGALIVRLKDKVTKLKLKIDTMISTGGPKVKNTDGYINDYVEYTKLLSESNRKSFEYNQEKDFVQKYGTRGAIMKKFSHKLALVEVSMDNKIADFDTTIIMLKKDYAFAREAKEGTQAAKDAMGFSSSWELEYALDVVTSTIAQDIAITTGNINDIDSYSTMSLDSDDLYAKLEALGNEINTGKDIVPEASDYRGLDYKLTGKDKIKSGGFDQLNDSMF